MARLGILTTHPIQYYAPWFRHLSERHDLTVYYAHRQDSRGQAQAGFGVEFGWDVPLLHGYNHKWLTNVARVPGLSSFNGCDTPEIAAEVAKRNFEAFLVLGWNKKSYWQAFWACKRTGTPLFCRCDSQLLTPRPMWQAAAKYLPYRMFLPRFDIHLYVGQRNREYLRHYGVRDSQLVFCPHFVDNDFFCSRANEARQTGAAARVRTEHGIPTDAFVLLYVGKFIPIKRVSDIVEAVVRVCRCGDGPELHLLLVGDGPLRSELERQAHDWQSNIHFAGFRNQQEMPAYYASSSAIVLASDSETWGLVVNEAMACGLPAIVSNAVGCGPDLVDEQATGLTFPLGNVEALSDRIVELNQRSAHNCQAMHDSVREKIAGYSLHHATAGLNESLQRIHRDPNPQSARGTEDAVDRECSKKPNRSTRSGATR